MPDFVPFRGIRYNPERFGTDLATVAAPPYDVIDDERRVRLGSLDPHNAVHVTLPEDIASTDRYHHAADTFRSWLDSGVLVVDADAAFYRYHVEFLDDGEPRSMTGVIGALELSPPGRDGILPHERTMAKPKGDRLELLRATRANLEPIWGLSLAAGLTARLAADSPVLAQLEDTRGARHELAAITDAERVAAIRNAVAAAHVVIADGHHRYETSLHYQEEQRATTGEFEPGAAHDFILALVVELSEDQLAVRPIHRVVRDLPDHRVLHSRLETAFSVVPCGPNTFEARQSFHTRMLEEGAIGMVTPDGLSLLVPRPEVIRRAMVDAPQPLQQVDAARFEAVVVPLLDEVGATVEYRHDRDVVGELVDTGAADAAFLLRPADVPTIEALARRGERMPQKTTFFHPKPSSGLVFRSLDVS